MPISLDDANCRVDQALAVLSMWLECTHDKDEANIISSIITLLDGVSESIEEANKSS